MLLRDQRGTFIYSFYYLKVSSYYEMDLCFQPSSFCIAPYLGYNFSMKYEELLPWPKKVSTPKQD